MDFTFAARLKATRPAMARFTQGSYQKKGWAVGTTHPKHSPWRTLVMKTPSIGLLAQEGRDFEVVHAATGQGVDLGRRLGPVGAPDAGHGHAVVSRLRGGGRRGARTSDRR